MASTKLASSGDRRSVGDMPSKRGPAGSRPERQTQRGLWEIWPRNDPRRLAEKPVSVLEKEGSQSQQEGMSKLKRIIPINCGKRRRC